MLDVNIYIDQKIMFDPTNPLNFIFSKEFRQKFFVTSSFVNLNPNKISIFTDLNNYIVNLILSKKIKNYFFILSEDKKLEIDLDYLKVLGNARKIYFTGDADNLFKGFSNYNYFRISLSSSFVVSEDKFIFENMLAKVYSEYIDCLGDKLYVLSDNDLSYWEGMFRKKGVKLLQVPISLSTVEYFRENYELVYSENLTGDSISNFIKNLIKDLGEYDNNEPCFDKVNIVCFNPTYLFKDLVERFVNNGCVHSDFPLEGYESYIWMRPQELWHLEYVKKNIEHREISKRYLEESSKIINNLDLDAIKSKSVMIHHGTCYEPLYQFDYNKLANSLYDCKKVVGVCEFEECYGPSKGIANKDNFVFVPIGYDSSLFKPSLIYKEMKKTKAIMNIGFVGRAYGTHDFNLLAKSKMAEPKGYRKGGDILEAIANKLKVMGVSFHLHILGQNWEHIVEYFDEVGIKCTYYARDKNITYQDFPSVYSKLDALLISARCEGGPVSAIEALSLGVPIVSSNVGVVKYLSEKCKSGVYTFNYDKKWHIADINTAVEHIIDLYNREIYYQERCEISSQVENLTTDNWVSKIIEFAKL